jgi:hypothetical protein
LFIVVPGFHVIIQLRFELSEQVAKPHFSVEDEEHLVISAFRCDSGCGGPRAVREVLVRELFVSALIEPLHVLCALAETSRLVQVENEVPHGVGKVEFNAL